MNDHPLRRWHRTIASFASASGIAAVAALAIDWNDATALLGGIPMLLPLAVVFLDWRPRIRRAFLIGLSALFFIVGLAGVAVGAGVYLVPSVVLAAAAAVPLPLPNGSEPHR